jgi:radical SAM family uncharacterized protein
MLELGGIPLLAEERANGMPVVVGGGACTVNPEPLAAFFDLFVVGEGEEVSAELCGLYLEHVRGGFERARFLREAARIGGVYVPSLYDVSYRGDGAVAAVSAREDAPDKVARRFVADFDGARAVRRPVLPYIGTIHDRCTLEIMRGCSNGCRFCQAGYATRPIRERRPDTLMEQARDIISATGYDEVSLCSLSSGDHPQITALIDGLTGEFSAQRVSVALPSLRANSFHFARRLNQVRKTGLTFAPEAGTQRLRDVINKNITEEEILDALGRAFESGVSTVKLYFMIGLPTETTEDLDGIAELVRKARERFYAAPRQRRGGGLSVNIGASCFVPKPCTPFQWEAQDELDVLEHKQRYLKDKLRMKGVRFSYHDARTSFLEAVLARGDRRLSAVLLDVWRRGARFDAWNEHFSYARYEEAFAACGIDPAFYANRTRRPDETLPYAHIDCLLSEGYLLRERDKAYAAATTPECRGACAGCGLQNKGCTLHGGKGAV